LRGRQPTPEYLSILKGNPSKRMRKNHPQPAGAFGSPPKHLAREAKKLWKKLVPELEANKLSATLFRTALEGLCSAYALMLQAQATIAELGPTMKVEKLHPATGAVVSTSYRPRPEVKIARDSWQFIRQVWGDFGMSPATVGRIEVPKQSAPGSKLNSFARLS
jgi:P27 family predicted phage terminase small subunit